MSSVADIEAALQKLSAEELAHVESVLHRLRSEGSLEKRSDGKRWPTTAQERETLVKELDQLPPVLREDEADRLDAWRAAEKERQRALMKSTEPGALFS